MDAHESKRVCSNTEERVWIPEPGKFGVRLKTRVCGDDEIGYSRWMRARWAEVGLRGLKAADAEARV